MVSAGERWTLLKDLEEWLDGPMIALSLAWLVIVLVELIWGESRVLATFGTVIWLIFLAEFALRLALAPDRIAFLKRSWLTILSLAVPALRMFRALRVLRVARALRGARLVRIVGTANRSMNALRETLHRRRFGYVAGLTLLVIVLGAAGMMSFEPSREVEGGFTSFGHALWWTAMLVSSLGSDFWPVTTEGRVLTLLLTVYGLAVFGYITASFASFFIGRDAAEPSAPVAGAEDLQKVLEEVRALRAELRRPER